MIQCAVCQGEQKKKKKNIAQILFIKSRKIKSVYTCGMTTNYDVIKK